MPLQKGKITEEVGKPILPRRHSGSNVHYGLRIQPGDDVAMEKLARDVVRVSFSQERMTYIPAESKVVYTFKVGKHGKTFDALDWPPRHVFAWALRGRASWFNPTVITACLSG